LADQEQITISFEGGLASSGQLHFYEFGRSQYALARFVATLELFRRTGVVADKINSNTYVEIIISSPERGSFLETIFVPAAVKAGSDFLTSKLSGLISYIWHLLSPRRESTENMLKTLAEIRLVEESQSTAREQERTKQLEILRGICEGHRATTEQALDLVRWSMTTPNQAVSRLEVPRREFVELQDELEAEQERVKEFEENEGELRAVDEGTMNTLTSRVRSMIPDMTLPLRRSADKMFLSPSKSAPPYVFLNKQLVKNLTEKESVQEISDIVGRVKGYDRDAGVGKFSSPDLPRVLSYIVPLREREQLIDKILEAMKRNKVILRCRKIIDRSGMPTSLILIDVLFD
jgi:hypothetical protein